MLAVCTEIQLYNALIIYGHEISHKNETLSKKLVVFENKVL